MVTMIFAMLLNYKLALRGSDPLEVCTYSMLFLSQTSPLGLPPRVVVSALGILYVCRLVYLVYSIAATSTDKHKHAGENGVHELGVNIAENGGPIRTFRKCLKNPGHRDFIRLEDFDETCLKDVPHAFNPYIVTRLVRSWAALVVKLNVTIGNESRRPESTPEGIPYPCGTLRNTTLNGSGWVHSITDKILGRCRCNRCQTTKQKKSCRFWKVRLHTARHVVFDESEAAKTEVVFFDEIFEHQRQDVIKVRGLQFLAY